MHIKNTFHIFADFDNTLTERDTTDMILSHFSYAASYKERYYNVSSSASWMKYHIGSLKITLEELQEFVLNAVQLREGVVNFVKECQAKRYPLTIVSDGLDYVINIVLAKYHLSGIKVYANHLTQDGDYLSLHNPNFRSNCKGGLGCCKCSVIEDLTETFYDAEKMHRKVVYIGDGSSDYCAAQRMSSVTFARDSLLAFCKSRKIKHLCFSNFINMLENIEGLEI